MSLPHITAEKTEYRNHWALNAGNYQQQGCYEWMASLLDSLAPKNVLDIGCGMGNGVLALLQRFSPNIVTIEENAECLTSTCSAVRDAGYPTQGIIRLCYREHPDGTHDLLTDQSDLGEPKKVTAVHADVLLPDRALDSFLDRQGPFDAVTVWLMGTYKARETCRNLANLVMEDSGSYRLHVQNRIYELAGRLLRSGGWLQVVDRGQIPDHVSLKDDLLNSHKEQAEGTDLEVFDLSYRGYQESERGIQMIATPGTSGIMPAHLNLGMISILSRQP